MLDNSSSPPSIPVPFRKLLQLPQRWLGRHFLKKLSHGQVPLIGLVGFRGGSGLSLICFISFLLGRELWINQAPRDTEEGNPVCWPEVVGGVEEGGSF